MLKNLLSARKVLLTIAILSIATSTTGCMTKVPPGYVGVKVNLAGGKRGVSEQVLAVGRYAVNPLTEDIYNFPTFRQNLVWTAGGDTDESITFSSKEGAQFNADIAMSYSFASDRVTKIFQEYRQTPEVIADRVVRREVADAFNRAASKMLASEIYGEGKPQLLDDVLGALKKDLEPMGFLVHSVGFSGTPRPEEKVQEQINRVIAAKQDAIAAQQEKLKQENLGAGKIAAAEAEARANQLKQSSLTPELLQYETIQKWDGVLPKVTGKDGGVFMNFD